MKDYSFRRSVAEKDVPQRQQIAENGAVVERGMRGNAAQKACSKGEAEIGDPQRQRIAEFAAGVERDSRGNAAQKAWSKGAAEIGAPQRQRIAEFAAVADRDCRGNATQKACSKGVAEKDVPQRQRIAEFAAVAVQGKDSRVSGTFGGTCRIFEEGRRDHVVTNLLMFPQDCVSLRDFEFKHNIKHYEENDSDGSSHSSGCDDRQSPATKTLRTQAWAWMPRPSTTP